MDFEEIKNKARKDIEKAIAEKEVLIQQLKTNFDNLDKFKIGNIIVNTQDEGDSIGDYTYLLIVGEPIIICEYVRIPIRHHVRPHITEKYCSLDMSGAVDIVKIPLSKLEKVKVITPKEMFNEQKNNLKCSLDDRLKTCKQKIERCKQHIKSAEATIDTYEGVVKTIIGFDFEDSFDNYVETYFSSNDFKYYAYQTNASVISYNDNKYTIEMKP